MEINNSLRGRDFISINDFTSDEIKYIIKIAHHLKSLQKKGLNQEYLKGKSLGMIFVKSSTRTRVAFEVGIYQLGGNALFLNPNDIQLGRGELIKDTARVLSRMLDGIMIRTFAHEDVLELAKWADIPIINGLTDLLHPTQIIADLMTIEEYKGKLRDIKIVFVGDGNNVAHSLLLGGAKVGMDVVVACPEGFAPDAKILELAQKDAKLTGAAISVIHDPIVACQAADVIYTDVWASMGQEAEAEVKEKQFAKYQVNQELLSYAKKDAMVMHCLPAKRGKEITDEVIEGPNSVVFAEAENRLHAHKAIMAAIM